MRIVAYYRVSTKKQGESGLGLGGQKAAVRDFAGQRKAEVVSEYVKVETGKRSDRPKLAKALAHAKRSMATLVVAKLDRLARNYAFLSALMEAKADFVACDNPTANKPSTRPMPSRNGPKPHWRLPRLAGSSWDRPALDTGKAARKPDCGEH
jgi:DNA invertase Pin-like site-specific DNA recombinase